jgi:dipeptidyl aminopeptidase/acylaminoacyl peptidase
VADYLSLRTSTQPTVSPDGTQVAYLANASGVPQIWLAPLSQQDPAPLRQLTHYPDRISFVSWSPDGRSLLFGKDSKGDERVQLFSYDVASGQVKTLTDEPKAIHRFGAWSDDSRRIAWASNARDVAHFDVYVQNLDNGKTERVLTEDDSYLPVAWSSDQRWLILFREVTNLDGELYLLDLRNGHKQLLTPHDGEALYDHVFWPRGSDSLYLVSNQDQEFLQLSRLALGIDAQGVAHPKLSPVLHTDWDVNDLAVSRSGQCLAWATDEDGLSRLHVALSRDITTERPVELPLHDGVTQGLAWSGDDHVLSFGWSCATVPTNIWDVHLPASLNNLPSAYEAEAATATNFEAVDPNAMRSPRLVHFAAADGRRIPAFLYEPTRPGPHAVILSVHGGPESQEKPVFSALYQYLLSRGYAVLAPNIRGSMGYGKTYLHLDDVGRRQDAIEDVAAAVAWLRQQSSVDPHRIAIMGASYGGYMTLASLAFHPELFAAGVDIVGMANLETFLQRTGAWRRRLREAEYGSLDRDLDLLRELSPIHHVDAMRAPLLVVAGAQDPRVPKEESDQIVQALRERHRDIEYLLFDDEGHGVVRLPNRIKAYAAIADFLDRVMHP